MNRRGFTLIELIATISVLGIISVISFVSISGIINKGKVNDCENLANSIKSSVKEYVSDNRYTFNNRDDFILTGDILVENKYLTLPIVNPFDNTNIAPSSIRVLVQLNNDYSAGNVSIQAPSILNNCSNGI